MDSLLLMLVLCVLALPSAVASTVLFFIKDKKRKLPIVINYLGIAILALPFLKPVSHPHMDWLNIFILPMILLIIVVNLGLYALFKYLFFKKKNIN